MTKSIIKFEKVTKAYRTGSRTFKALDEVSFTLDEGEFVAILGPSGAGKSALLAIVVLYNLGVLSFTEKERELATMRVLGFQSGAIRRLLLAQNVWLSILALVPGYYFGVFILSAILANMGSEFDMVLDISFFSIAVCTAFTMFLSVVVNYLFSGRVKCLDMVEALKSME